MHRYIQFTIHQPHTEALESVVFALMQAHISYEDICHVRKTMVTLLKTDRIIRKIDAVAVTPEERLPCYNSWLG